MTERELLKVIGETPESYIMKAMETRGRKERKKHISLGTWLTAAAIAASLTVTAAAVSHYLNLTAYLKDLGMQDTTGVEALQQEVGEGFSTDLADFKILEAVRDENLIYISAEIRPKDSGDLLIPEYATPGQGVEVLQMEGIREGTVQDFADAYTKRLVSAGILLENVSPVTVDMRCTPEGTIYVYLTTENGLDKETLTVKGFTKAPEGAEPVSGKTEITLKDSSTGKEQEFRTFDPKIAEDLKITPLSLTFRETELGVQMRFVYRGNPDRASNTHFCALVDGEGKELPRIPLAGSFVEDDEDGTFTVVDYYQKMDSFEGLSLKISHHGPYTFSK